MSGIGAGHRPRSRSVSCFSRLAVSMFFVYEAKLAAIIFAGVGTPLILAGIANWMGSPGVTGPTQMYLNSLTLTLFIFSEGAIFFAMFIAYYYLRITHGK